MSSRPTPGVRPTRNPPLTKFRAATTSPAVDVATRRRTGASSVGVTNWSAGANSRASCAARYTVLVPRPYRVNTTRSAAGKFEHLSQVKRNLDNLTWVASVVGGGRRNQQPWVGSYRPASLRSATPSRTSCARSTWASAAASRANRHRTRGHPGRTFSHRHTTRGCPEAACSHRYPSLPHAPSTPVSVHRPLRNARVTWADQSLAERNAHVILPDEATVFETPAQVS